MQKINFHQLDNSGWALGLGYKENTDFFNSVGLLMFLNCNRVRQSDVGRTRRALDKVSRALDSDPGLTLCDLGIAFYFSWPWFTYLIQMGHKILVFLLHKDTMKTEWDNGCRANAASGVISLCQLFVTNLQWDNCSK